MHDPSSWLLALAAGLILAARPAAAATNLVRNGDFERLFVAGGPAPGWSAVRTPPGGDNRAERGAGIEGGTCHLIAAPDSAEVTWYVCGQTVHGLTPGGRYVVSAWVRTEGVRGGSGAYIGMNYYDGRGERLSWTDSDRKVTGTAGWTRVEQPFTVPAGTQRVMLALVLHGRGRAFFDRVMVEAGDRAGAWLAGPHRGRAPSGRRRDRGTIAIYRDDIPPTGTPSNPVYLRGLAEAAGYGCTYLDSAALADPTALSAARCDLLVLPYGSSFPAAAADNLRAFLRDGGSLLTVGGYPLDRLKARQNGVWRDLDRLEPDTRHMAVVLDPARPSELWQQGGRYEPVAGAERAAGPPAPRVGFGTARMADGGWVTLSSPGLSGLPRSARSLAFYARADQDGLPVAIEVDENDGARWRARVELDRQWRLHAVSLADLEYWKDNPSQGRGGPGDHVRPENAARVSFGLTTEFLKAGQPYHVEIGRVFAGPDDLPNRQIRLNSHFAGINPATFLVPPADAISICDAGAPLSDAAGVVATPGSTALVAGWRMAGAVRGFSATGQTAQGDPGAPLKARWVPLADAVDRYGRRRGTAFAVMHHYAGEYAGSSWAYSGISNRDVFAPGDAAGAALFRAALERTIGSAFLFDARAGSPCPRPGERIRPEVAVANTAGVPREFVVRMTASVGARALARQERTVRLPARSGERVGFAWSVPSGLDADLVRVVFELRGPGPGGARRRPTDRLATGAALWNPARLARGARVGYKGCYFDRGRGPEFLVGTQIYWGNPTVTGTDPLRWAEQLGQMADNGIRIARTFTNVPEAGTEAGWRYRDALVQLSQGAGVSLFYAGVSTVTTDPALVAERAKEGARAAERYRQAPGWFVDIVNEPALSVGQGPADSREFAAWLRRRYGTLDALRAAWGTDLVETSFDGIRVGPMAGPWTSMRAVDTHRFMSEKMRIWAGETARAIHAVDPDRLVSLGSLQGFGDAATTWDPIDSARDLDFANRHYYGNLGGYAPELKQTDQRTLGRAPSTGEFGGTSHPGLKAHFVYEPEPEIARRYAYTLHACFGLGGAFAANWHWQDPIEDIFPCGLLLADGAPRDRLYPFRAIGMLLRTVRPRYEPPALYFVIPTSHRFGTSAGPVVEAMDRSLAALISLHVGFGTVSEGDLATLPASARALVWPVPFCPDDETYARVRDFVRRGGSLYVSGDLSFDGLRRRTRTDRLRELCGVAFESEEPAGTANGQPVVAADGPLAAALAAEPLRTPALRVRPTSGRVLAHLDGAPVAVANRCGEGHVLFVVDPVEMRYAPRALLAAFLQRVGVRRHALSPDLADVQSHRVTAVDGGVAQLLFNTGAETRRVTISDLPAPVALTLAPGSGGAVIFDGHGRLVAVEGQAVEVGGRLLHRADSPAIQIALDGADLRTSPRRVVVPLGAGTLRLGGLPAEAAAAAGEVRGGRWQTYESVALKGGRLVVDGAMARSLILVGGKGALPGMGRAVAASL